MEFAGTPIHAPLQMSFEMTNYTLIVALAFALLDHAAYAQGRAKPDDPAAPAAPLEHISSFQGYQPFRDEPLAPWREVNETAHRIGGHVGVLRAETQGPLAPAGASGLPSPPVDATRTGVPGQRQGVNE